QCRKHLDDDGAVRAAFVVEDTGSGISQEAQERLFHEFEQESLSTSREYGGSGLGLSICKRLVEAMGGTIGVESTKGQGSKFFFEIRLATGDAAAVAAVESATPMTAAKALEGKALNILLAEDILPNQFLLTKMLSLWGHKVTAVDNGEEAVAEANER